MPRARYSPASEMITTELHQPVFESASPGTIHNSSEIYHDIGPSVLILPNPSSDGMDTLRSDHTYQYIEAGTIGTEPNNIYEDPNQPNDQVSVHENITR